MGEGSARRIGGGESTKVKGMGRAERERRFVGIQSEITKCSGAMNISKNSNGQHVGQCCFMTTMKNFIGSKCKDNVCFQCETLVHQFCPMVGPQI